MPGRYKFHLLGQAALALGLALSAASASHAAGSMLAVHSDRPSLIDLGLAKPTGDVDSTRRIALTLTFPLSNKADLDQFVQDVATPGSSRYGCYLTPAEFAARYGASQIAYNSVVAWAKSNGLTVTKTSLSRQSLALSGTAAQVQLAFGVKLNNYVDATGKAFYSAATEPQMPAALAGFVHGVYGMSSHATGHPMYAYLSAAERAEALAARSLRSGFGAAPIDASGPGSGHAGAFSPEDLKKAFQVPELAVRGKGQSLGFFAQGGIYAGDAAVYESYYHLPPTPVIPVSVAGTNTQKPVGGVALEASLDMDMELAMAPSAKALYCYEAGSESSFAGALLDGLTAVADDDKISTFDISYGLDEATQISDIGLAGFDDENTAFEQCAAEGISVFVSSGDEGAYGDLGGDFDPAGYNVEDPASQPFVTAVGGTTLFFVNGIDAREEAWNGFPSSGASGGGTSFIWKIPSYQVFPDGTSIATYNGGSGSYRNVPDVAAVGDPLTGVDVFTSDTTFVDVPEWLTLGGTSAAAPLWTGFAGVVNQQRADAGLPAIGFANPLFYGIYDQQVFNNNTSILDFDDVTSGSNGNINLFGRPGYSTGFGYDNVTGLGSLSAAKLMNDIFFEPSRISSGRGPLPGDPANFQVVSVTPTSVSLQWSTTSKAKGYLITENTIDPYYGNDQSIQAPVKATMLTHATVGALKPNTFYIFSLTAVNNNGANADNYYQTVFATTSAK